MAQHWQSPQVCANKHVNSGCVCVVVWNRSNQQQASWSPDVPHSAAWVGVVSAGHGVFQSLAEHKQSVRRGAWHEAPEVGACCRPEKSPNGLLSRTAEASVHRPAGSS